MSLRVKVETSTIIKISHEGAVGELVLNEDDARTLKKLLNDIPALNLQQPKAPPIPQAPQPHLSKMLTQEQIAQLTESYKRLRKEKEALEKAQKPWTEVLHPSFWRGRPWPPADLVGGAQSGPDSWAAKSAPGGGYEFP